MKSQQSDIQALLFNNKNNYSKSELPPASNSKKNQNLKKKKQSSVEKEEVQSNFGDVANLLAKNEAKKKMEQKQHRVSFIKDRRAFMFYP